MGSEVPYPGMVQAIHSVQVRAKGRWITTPGIEVNRDVLITYGTRLKIAKIRGEEMREKEIEDPAVYLAALRSEKGRILKADIFTFAQKLPDVHRKYSYPSE